MKNRVKVLSCVLFLGILLTACGEDDKKNNGSFSVLGKSYSLSKGLIASVGEVDEGVYGMGLMLTSDGISWSGTGMESTVEGKGEVIILEMYSSERNGLAVGTYNYEYYYNYVEEFTFDMGYVAIGLDAKSESTDYIHTIYDGSLKVKENEGEYDIEFSLFDSDGQKITGKYKGDIQFVSSSNFFGKTNSESPGFSKIIGH